MTDAYFLRAGKQTIKRVAMQALAERGVGKSEDRFKEIWNMVSRGALFSFVSSPLLRHSEMRRTDELGVWTAGRGGSQGCAHARHPQRRRRPPGHVLAQAIARPGQSSLCVSRYFFARSTSRLIPARLQVHKTPIVNLSPSHPPLLLLFRSRLHDPSTNSIILLSLCLS